MVTFLFKTGINLALCETSQLGTGFFWGCVFSRFGVWSASDPAVVIRRGGSEGRLSPGVRTYPLTPCLPPHPSRPQGFPGGHSTVTADGLAPGPQHLPRRGGRLPRGLALPRLAPRLTRRGNVPNGPGTVGPLSADFRAAN